MKLKLITEVLILCSKPEKRRERLFHSLSCSFTFTWWTVRQFQFQNPIVVYFLALYWAPFDLAPQAAVKFA